MTGGAPEICSNIILTLLTFGIWHLIFDIWFLSFDIWHKTFDIWQIHSSIMARFINYNFSKRTWKVFSFVAFLAFTHPSPARGLQLRLGWRWRRQQRESLSDLPNLSRISWFLEPGVCQLQLVEVLYWNVTATVPFWTSDQRLLWKLSIQCTLGAL